MNTITLYGKIGFEPEDYTRKHKDQSSWKKIAMVFIQGDICEYYAWLLQRQHAVVLNKPLRSAHISFINDSMRDLTNKGAISETEALLRWEECKNKWDGKEIEIVLELTPKTDNRSWWFNIPQDKRDLLHEIRAEVGLGRPHFGLHMSLGYANEINIEHSKYIHEGIVKGWDVANTNRIQRLIGKGVLKYKDEKFIN